MAEERERKRLEFKKLLDKELDKQTAFEKGRELMIGYRKNVQDQPDDAAYNLSRLYCNELYPDPVIRDACHKGVIKERMNIAKKD